MLENNSFKSRHLREIKKNFRTYSHEIVDIGIQKTLKFLQTELC